MISKDGIFSCELFVLSIFEGHTFGTSLRMMRMGVDSIPLYDTVYYLELVPKEFTVKSNGSKYSNESVNSLSWKVRKSLLSIQIGNENQFLKTNFCGDVFGNIYANFLAYDLGKQKIHIPIFCASNSKKTFYEKKVRVFQVVKIDSINYLSPKS